MLKKIKSIFYITSVCIFVILITIFYFSEKNIKKTYKTRLFYLTTLESNFQNLPLLKNDTNGVIEYSDGIEIYKKNRKKYIFWDLIKK